MEQCPECLADYEESEFIILECGVAMCPACADCHDCSVCFSEESDYEPSEVTESGQSCGDSATEEDLDAEEDPESE